MKKYLITLAFSLFPYLAHGQGIPFAVIPPAPNAQINVCNAPAVGSNPCTNRVTIYGDVALSQPITQPAQIGPTGAYTFFYAATTGALEVQITGRGDQIIPGGGGIAFVASLPATCTPGVTASVQLSVAPYTINYCSAPNTWTSAGAGTAAISAVTTRAIYATDPQWSGGVKGGAIHYCDAAWTNGSTTVTINNSTGDVDQQFTPAMNGWFVYGTNSACSTGQQAGVGVRQVPLGVLSGIVAPSNSATISVPTTAPCTSVAGNAICQLVIGQFDDIAAWQAAWTATWFRSSTRRRRGKRSQA